MKQLKEMANELKSYQSQVNAYQYEIERIDKEILETKKKWFSMRRKQLIEQGAINGVIPEEDEQMEMEGEQNYDLRDDDGQIPEGVQEGEFEHVSDEEN